MQCFTKTIQGGVSIQCIPCFVLYRSRQSTEEPMEDQEDPFQIIVLFDGYSRPEGDDQLANCTCTLIKGPINIVVDTMTAWDGPVLKSAIEKNGLTCENIKYVVCTHGHSDHIGCNYLFPNAIHIVGFSISKFDRYFEHDFDSGKEYLINDRIKLIPTPGHTLQDVTVVVKTRCKGTVAIAGDLFEREEDLLDDDIWISSGSDSEQLQRENRQKILSLADYIVPGHGPMFKVPKCVASK